jgi:PII-like signaling protein
MTHVFRTHAHKEHVLRVVDLPIVVVILDTLEQCAVSIVGSIHIFTTDDN